VVAQPTLEGVGKVPGPEEAIEVEAVIWFGIAAIIVIALVIAAIGQPPDGPGGTRSTAARGDRAPAARGGSRRGAGV
jgi:hypothetical protein